MERLARRALMRTLASLEVGDSPASRNQVEALVDASHAAPSSKTSKRKKQRGDLISAWQRPAAVNKEEPSSRTKVADLHEARGSKRGIASTPDVEAPKRDQLARSNKDVDAKGRMPATSVVE